MKTSSKFSLTPTIKTIGLFLFYALTASAQTVDMRVAIVSHAGNAVTPIAYQGEMRVPMASQFGPSYRVELETRDPRGTQAPGVHEVTTSVAELWDDQPELFGDELPPSIGPIRINYPSHIVQLIGPGGRTVTPDPISVSYTHLTLPTICSV